MSESHYEMIIYWDKTDNIYAVDVPELDDRKLFFLKSDSKTKTNNIASIF